LDQTRVSGSRQCQVGRPAGHSVPQAPKVTAKSLPWEKKEVPTYLVLLSHLSFPAHARNLQRNALHLLQYAAQMGKRLLRES